MKLLRMPIARAALLTVTAGAVGAAALLAPDLIRGQGGGEKTIRVAAGPQGQPGPVDIGFPPDVEDNSPPRVIGPFRSVASDVTDKTSAAFNANAELVAGMAPVPIERLRVLPSFAEPSYLPTGYVLASADAVFGAGDVKSYELHYKAPHGWELTVARIVGYTLPYDVQRPLMPPQGYTELRFGNVNGNPAAFTSLSQDPSVLAGNGTIIIVSGRTVTIVAGHIARASGVTLTFDGLLRVAESIRRAAG